MQEKARNAIADKQLTTPAGYGLDSPALSEMLRKPTDSPKVRGAGCLDQSCSMMSTVAQIAVKACNFTP